MYCTVDDVLLVSGFSNMDFNYNGQPMTSCQFEAYVNSLIEDVTVQINRYCNVDTFEEHTVTDEYHTMTTFDIPGSYRYTSYSTPFRVGGMFFAEQETDKARTVFPREQPVIQIEKVEVNLTSWTGAQDAPQTWVELHERGKPWVDEHGVEHIGGDYDVISYFETSKLYLVGKRPRYGKNNIRITYKAGFPKSNDIWKALRSACRIAIVNVLNYKFKQQQAVTLRASGMMDYASLVSFGNDGEYSYLSKEVKDILDKYRVSPLPNDMYE